jgi:hypothetical protein
MKTLLLSVVLFMGSIAVADEHTLRVDINDALALHIPREGDTMTVVHVDAKWAVMVDDTVGTSSNGEFKEALVVFAYSPSYKTDIDGAVAESGRISLQCDKLEYKLLSDNILNGQNTVIQQRTMPTEYKQIDHDSIVGNVYRWVCKHEKQVPPGANSTKKAEVL